MQKSLTKKKSNKSTIIIAGTMLAIMVITFIVSKFFYQFLLVRGNSMSPTYRNLQLAVLEKRVDEYEVGDVVAFRSETLDEILIKRIVACPGDRICILNGTLYVNGEVSTNYSDTEFAYAGILQDEIHLGDDQYIVIGDNIEQSRDSRFEEVGIVLYDDLLGRVL